jgi:hypothetical protein
LKIGEASLGPTHPDVVATLSNYGALLRKLNRKAEASKIETRVREIRATTVDDNPARFDVDWRDLRK